MRSEIDSISPKSLSEQLSSLLGKIRAGNSPEAWEEVEITARDLASSLQVRIKGGLEDIHSSLGKSSLPQTLIGLFTLSLHGSSIPEDANLPYTLQLLRVGANLCINHDENRGQLLEVGLPQAIISVLEGYTELIPSELGYEPLPLTIPHLKIVKTAIGTLLNLSLGFDPVKFRLISLEAALTVQKLSLAVYPPGSWIIKGINRTEEETWDLRVTISNWASRVIQELKDVKDETLQIFNSDVLPFLMPALILFIPSFHEHLPIPPPDSLGFAPFLQADFDALEESCMLIESLSLDVEDVRLSLARGFKSPVEHGGVPCLSTILDFLEMGNYLQLWSELEDYDRTQKERAFDMCKTALIKAIVEIAGDPKNEDVLWDNSDEGKPGGLFVSRMAKWIKDYVVASETFGSVEEASQYSKTGVTRHDLVVCASLSLGNLAKKDNHSIALLSAPHSLAPILASKHLLFSSSDINLQNGVLGLLKHLAMSSPQSNLVQTALGDAGVIQRLSESGVWDEKVDAIAGVIQIRAIGVVKHLCNASLDNTFALVLPSSTQVSSSTCLAQILALVNRSDSVPIKSEGTRVLVNVVRSLWFHEPSSSPANVASTVNENSEKDVLLSKMKKRQEARDTVLTPECAFALASLIGRSVKYPLLINEGVVAMTLLCTNKAGAALVSNAILSLLPIEATPQTELPSASASNSSQVSSPITSPPMRNRPSIPRRRALEMLISVIRNLDNPVNYQPEVRLNVCALFVQLGKNGPGDDLGKIKEASRPALEKLLENPTGRDTNVSAAAKKVLDGWA